MTSHNPAAPETKSAAKPAGALAELAARIDAQGRDIAAIATKAAAPRAVGNARARLDEITQRALKALRDSADEETKANRAGRGVDPLLAQRMARQNAEIDQATDAARDLEVAELKSQVAELQRKAARPAGPSGLMPGAAGRSQKSAAFARHKKAVDRYMRTGQEVFNGEHLREIEAKALTSERSPDGGFLVHPEYDTGPVERYLMKMVAMRRIAQVRTISAFEFVKPMNQGGAVGGWVGERQARTETATPTLGELRVPTQELWAKPSASQRLLDDAAVDMEGWLADEVNITFAEMEDAGFISGTSVQQPDGLLGNSGRFVADASWTPGKLGYIVTGGASDFASTGPMDALIDLMTALKGGYRANASFLMNRLTIGKIRKFKDTTGQYLWQPSTQAGQPASLLGYPCEESDAMPDIGANAFPIAFGDFKRGYLIVDRVGIRVLRDPYSDKPNVQFYTTKRVGGGVQNDEAIKLLKVST